MVCHRGVPQDSSAHSPKHPDQQRVLFPLQGKQVFCEDLCARLKGSFIRKKGRRRGKGRKWKGRERKKIREKEKEWRRGKGKKRRK